MLAETTCVEHSIASIEYLKKYGLLWDERRVSLRTRPSSDAKENLAMQHPNPNVLDMSRLKKLTKLPTIPSTTATPQHS